MGYGIRDGDIISLTNEKAGALTMSVDLLDYKGSKITPEWMWRHQSSIRSVVNFKTRAIAGVPFNLYDRQPDGGRVRNYTDAVAVALQRPATRLGQSRWVQQLQFDLATYGRWACAVHWLPGGGFQLLRLPAERVSLLTDAAGNFEALGIQADGKMHTRPLDDVIFDVSTGPSQGEKRIGYSDLETLIDLALELSGLSEYRANLFRNSAMVPAVIERPTDAPKWTDEAWKRFKEDFAQYKAGGGNAGGTPLLEDGMTLKPVDVFNPKDAQYVEVRELALVEAAQALNIPPELVGAKDGTHSNIVALREQLYQDVLGTDIKFFEDALNSGLERILDGRQYVEANLDSKLRGTLEQRARIYQTASGRPWLTTNEVRALENKPAIEGGDDLVTPLNVLLGGQASPADGGATGSHPGGGGMPADDIAKRVTAAAALIRSGFEPTAALEAVGLDPITHLGLLPVTVQKPVQPDGEIDQEIEEQIKSRVFELEPKALVAARPKAPGRKAAKGQDKLDRATAGMETAVLGWWHQHAEWLAGRLGVNLDAEDGKARRKSLPPMPTAEELQEAVDMLAAELLTQTKAVAEAGADIVLLEWNPDAENFDIERQQAWLAKASTNNALRFNDQILDWISDAMNHPEEWEAAVRKVLTSDADVQNWITGLATEAASFGETDAAKASGLAFKTWRTTSKKPRESHAAQNGATVGIDDAFTNGQRYPGDWWGGAAEVFGCHCRLDFSK
jgi:HK97 family phage portal protein